MKVECLLLRTPIVKEPQAYTAKPTAPALVGIPGPVALAWQRGCAPGPALTGRRVTSPGMLLSDRDILKALDASSLLIEPLDRGQIQPASVDIRLGASFRRYLRSDATVIDSEAPQAQVTETFEVAPGDSLLLQPHELILGCSMERLRLPEGIAGILEGKSSLGRLGMFMHTNAGLIDPGFEGTITLNLLNVAALPIKIRPGMRIGQLCLFQLSSNAQRPYGSVGLNSHYQNQSVPTPSWGAEGVQAP